jgi:hypothetical protein
VPAELLNKILTSESPYGKGDGGKTTFILFVLEFHCKPVPTEVINGDLFITSSRLVLRGTSPTLYLRDTDNRSGMIHMNSNVMYFLNANGNDSETWAQQNGQDWCLQLLM